MLGFGPLARNSHNYPLLTGKAGQKLAWLARTPENPQVAWHIPARPARPCRDVPCRHVTARARETVPTWGFSPLLRAKLVKAELSWPKARKPPNRDGLVDRPRAKLAASDPVRVRSLGGSLPASAGNGRRMAVRSGFSRDVRQGLGSSRLP